MEELVISTMGLRVLTVVMGYKGKNIYVYFNAWVTTLK